MVVDRDDYFFDLQGFLHLEGALTKAEVKDLNDCLDVIPPLKPGEWFGYIHGHQYGDKTSGVNYQQIYEAGEPFEKLIDHPSWIDKIRRFVGGEGTFDYNHGSLFIDENHVNFREPGEAIGLHSSQEAKRGAFAFRNGKFMCGQINLLVALTDIGPGDGPTMVVPGSHKSNFPHPYFNDNPAPYGASVDNVEGAIEIYMPAGDALLFVDWTAHGAAKRVNPGERRMVVYRYGPSWGNFRYGYQPSPELLERLTPERRQIVSPQRPIARPS